MRASFLSRRSFLKASAAAGALQGVPLWAQGGPDATSWALFGTGNGEGIYRSRWNAATGQFTAPELAVATKSPSFLALHPHLPVVYACNEGGGAGSVSAFTVERSAGQLTLLGTQPAGGEAPCYVSVDHTGQLLFAANYTSGSVAVFPLDQAGKPAPAARLYTSPAGHPGPVADRQESPHMHCAVISPENGYMLACDLGRDHILSFPIHPGTAAPMGDPRITDTKPGAGPRHVTFHPNGRWLYCINELGCDVVQYEWRPKSKGAPLVPALGAAASVLPATAQAGSTPPTAAEVAISRDGRFLYASTRGVDLLTVFAIQPRDGALRQVQQLPCGGVQPRFFSLDPSDRFLLCAHQAGNSITTFARDAHTGNLTQGATLPATDPQCIVWL